MRASLAQVSADDSCLPKDQPDVGLFGVTTDVEEFRALAHQGTEEARRRATQLIRGQPFQNLMMAKSQWIADMKLILTKELDQVLAALAIDTIEFHHDNYVELLRIGRMRMDLDPSSVAALTNVIRAHYELGDFPAALQVAREFRGGPQAFDQNLHTLLESVHQAAWRPDRWSEARRPPVFHRPDDRDYVEPTTNWVYAAHDDYPDAEFERDLLGDVCASTTYAFAGVDVAPLLGRILIRDPPLARIRVVIPDPRQHETVLLRVTELIGTPAYRRYTTDQLFTMLQHDLLAVIVALFDLRHESEVHAALWYRGTRDHHILDDAAYICTRHSEASRGRRYPEARRYNRRIQEENTRYAGYKQKFAELEASCPDDHRFAFNDAMADVDLFRLFGDSDIAVHPGNIDRLRIRSQKLAQQHADEQRHLRNTAHHHRRGNGS